MKPIQLLTIQVNEREVYRNFKHIVGRMPDKREKKELMEALERIIKKARIGNRFEKHINTWYMED